MGTHVEEVSLPPTHGVAVRATVPIERLPAFFGAALLEATEVAKRAGARVVGPPFARYHTAPPGPVDVEAVVPVDHAVAVSGPGRVHPLELPAGAALKARHVGPYDALGPVYAELGQWMAEHHQVPADAPREVYLTDPQSERDPSKWVTLVLWPVRGPDGAALAA